MEYRGHYDPEAILSSTADVVKLIDTRSSACLFLRCTQPDMRRFGLEMMRKLSISGSIMDTVLFRTKHNEIDMKHDWRRKRKKYRVPTDSLQRIVV